MCWLNWWLLAEGRSEGQTVRHGSAEHAHPSKLFTTNMAEREVETAQREHNSNSYHIKKSLKSVSKEKKARKINSNWSIKDPLKGPSGVYLQCDLKEKPQLSADKSYSAAHLNEVSAIKTPPVLDMPREPTVLPPLWKLSPCADSDRGQNKWLKTGKHDFWLLSRKKEQTLYLLKSPV